MKLCRSIGVAWVLSGAAAWAGDFTWLSTPASASWNETDANWTGAGTMWASAPTNNAIFGASGTQSVTADAVTLGSLTFNADGYTISGGPLLMYGGFAVGSGQTAVLNATVTNTFGICGKSGAGTLVLDPGVNGTNLFSTFSVSNGTVYITGGTHEIYTNSGAAIYTGFDIRGGAVVVSGGKVRMTSGGYSDVYGSLLVTNATVDLSASRELLNAFNGAGVTTIADQGVLNVQTFRISQNGGSQNAININPGGTLWVNKFYIDTGANPKGTVNFNGGTVIAKTSASDFLGTDAAQWLVGISAKILAGGAVIDTQANAISIKQPLVSGAAPDGGLVKKGSGALTLLSTNSYSGPTVIYGGTVNVVRDQSLGAAPASPATNLLFMASGTLQCGSNNWLSASRTVWVTNAATATFDTQSYTQAVYGAIVCAETNSSVVKTGGGTLVLDPGASAVNVFGTLQTAVGTLVVASGTNLVTTPNKGQNAPGLRVSGGTMLVAGGVVKTTNLMFVNVDGGHLLVTNGLLDTTSCYEILNSIGNTNNGYTTVSGSGVILANAVRISQSSGSPSNSVVSVSTGGVMRLNNFYIDTNFSGQKGMLFLNGGTVEARRTETNFLGRTATFLGTNDDRWLTNIWAVVREGGAIFDTLGYTVGVKNPLLSGAPADGGLTKRGAGRLILFNTNTFNGATSVQEGTLELARDDALPAANTVYVSTNTVLDVAGKAQALAGLGGSGTVVNPGGLSVTGTIAPGDAGSFGTLTFASAPAALGGTLSVNVSTNGACDRLHVVGDLNLASLSLSVEDTSQLAKYRRYTVASCTGALGAPFAAVGALPARWLVRCDVAAKQAYLVYDFGTLINVL